VKILLDEHRQVAVATVARDGRFTTTAPLPPATVRESTATRYSAAIGAMRSLSLKLTRRLLLEAPTSAHGRVLLRGTVRPPLTSPVAPVLVEQELECGRSRIVRRFEPGPGGRFSVSLPAPAGARVAVYRLASRVSEHAGEAGAGFPTYSLPLPVRIG
jgi:hypothetical protein